MIWFHVTIVTRGMGRRVYRVRAFSVAHARSLFADAGGVIIAVT